VKTAVIPARARYLPHLGSDASETGFFVFCLGGDFALGIFGARSMVPSARAFNWWRRLWPAFTVRSSPAAPVQFVHHPDWLVGVSH
jgi:hypothetical protein